MHTLVGVTKLVRYGMLLYIISLCQSIEFLLSSQKETCHKGGTILNSPPQASTYILSAADGDWHRSKLRPLHFLPAPEAQSARQQS